MATPAQSLVAKEDPLTKLKEGPAAWNAWLATLSESQRKAINLSGADLSRSELTAADLSGANLRDSDLRNSQIKGLILTNADLRRANLSGLDFDQVELTGADLRETKLQGADLSTANGTVLYSQLAGSILTGAKLPDSLSKRYEDLGFVSDISESARKLFLALLAGSVYCSLSAVGDVGLITNRVSSPLPIIQTTIPSAGFYVISPVILFGAYLYFHAYLQKLWEELASLPATFPDG